MSNGLVILNYNSYELTLKLALICEKYDLLKYIVIVDNNSQDDSIKYLNEVKSEKIIIISNLENKGYAYGNNVGIRYLLENTNCENIIIANPDIQVSEKVLNECIEILNSNEEYGIIAPRIRNVTTKGEPAWKFPTYLEYILSLFFITNKLNLLRKYKFNRMDRVIEVDVIPGSLIVGKGKLLNEIKGFDENTFLYCEECILSKKIKEKGKKILLVYNLEYIHEHGAIIKKELKSKMKQYEILNKSKSYYIKKYMKCGSVKIKIFNILVRISMIEKYFISKIARR